MEELQVLYYWQELTCVRKSAGVGEECGSRRKGHEQRIILRSCIETLPTKKNKA